MNAKSVTLTFVRQPLLIRVSEFRGEQRLDIRHCFYDEAGELIPLKNKGVNIPLADASNLVEAVKQTLDNGQEVYPDISVSKPIATKASLFRGERRLDIRHHWDKNGKLIPLKAGVNLPAKFGSNLLVALDDVLSSVKVAA